MNYTTVSLSSGSTNSVIMWPLVELEDHTQLNLQLTDINEDYVPLYLKISWGDGKVETFDNNLYKKDKNLIKIQKYSPILLDSYAHEFFPSSYANYKELSAQVLLEYSNGNSTWIVIPIRIRTYDYFESVSGLELVNTNILPLSSNASEHQLKASVNNQLIEFLQD